MYLLDTNALILFHKEKLESHAHEKKLYTTILSLIEYPPGTKVNDLSILFPGIDVYSQSLVHASNLRNKGTPIPAIDVIIGAIASKKKLVLVTEDTHFTLLKAVLPQLEIISYAKFKKKILDEKED